MRVDSELVCERARERERERRERRRERERERERERLAGSLRITSVCGLQHLVYEA
jgi:hypothetical protein